MFFILKETNLKVIDNSEVICEVKYKFMKIYQFYKLDNKCDHLDFETCSITKVSTKELKCPIYFCKNGKCFKKFYFLIKLARFLYS